MHRRRRGLLSDARRRADSLKRTAMSRPLVNWRGGIKSLADNN
jgi:hypothetical protein